MEKIKEFFVGFCKIGSLFLIVVIILAISFYQSNNQVYKKANFAKAETIGNTYYISTTGLDTNTGKAASDPFKSFSKAVSVLVPGDTLLIFGGTYTTPLIVNKNGLSGSPIIIKPVDTQQVTIDVENQSIRVPILVSGNFVELSGPNFKTIGGWSGVELTGENIVVDSIEVTRSTGHGIISKGHLITVKNCVIHNTVLDNYPPPKLSSGWGSALKVERGADGIIYEGNYMYDNYGEGIAVTMGKNVLVKNNRVSNNWQVEIYVDNSSFVQVVDNFMYCSQAISTGLAMNEEYYSGWGNQLSDIYIGKNIISGCKSGITSWGSGDGSQRVSIEYNTFYGITDSVLYFASHNYIDVTISHNIFKNIKPWFDSGVIGVSMNNNYWISTLPYSGSGTLGTNDKAGNPIWMVTPAWNDPETFKQALGSPACGFGKWDCGTTLVLTSVPTNNPTPTPTQVIVDTAPPIGYFTSPINGSKLLRTVNVNVQASDIGSGVDSMKIYFDSILVKTCTNINYCSKSFKTNNVVSGNHSFSATIIDKAGLTNQTSISVYK